MELPDLCGAIYGVDDDEEYTTYCDLAVNHDPPHSHGGQIFWNDEEDISLDDTLTEPGIASLEESK